jgi:hypothetical protein
MFSGFKSLQQATPSQVRNGMIYTEGQAQGHLSNSTYRYMMLRLCKYSSANVTCVHSRTGDSAEIGYDKIMMSSFIRERNGGWKHNITNLSSIEASNRLGELDDRAQMREQLTARRVLQNKTSATMLIVHTHQYKHQWPSVTFEMKRKGNLSGRLWLDRRLVDTPREP